MNELADIESTLIDRIVSIQANGAALFAVVKGFSSNNPREVVMALRQELKPAAFVIYTGRRVADAWGVPDVPGFSVFAIAQSLRGGNEPRTGSALTAGGFDLLGELLDALAGQMLLADRSLAFVDERLVAADETSLVWEQRYSVLRPATAAAPTFGGAAICGADSIVTVEVAEWAADDQRFAFPGIDGEFRTLLGLRARSIVWKGQLRANADGDLNAIELQIEQLITSGLPEALGDGHGRLFQNCAVQRFNRKGSRRKHPVTGRLLQDFELYFVHLI